MDLLTAKWIIFWAAMGTTWLPAGFLAAVFLTVTKSDAFFHRWWPKGDGNLLLYGTFAGWLTSIYVLAVLYYNLTMFLFEGTLYGRIRLTLERIFSGRKEGGMKWK